MEPCAKHDLCMHSDGQVGSVIVKTRSTIIWTPQAGGFNSGVGFGTCAWHL